MFTEKNDEVVMEGGGALAIDAASVRRPRSFVRPAEAAVATGRYGERKGLDPIAILLVVALHAVLLAALLTARTYYVKKQGAELVTVNLTPPPEPPAATPETPPEPAKTPVVAPTPVVQVPVPSPVFATPDPVPAPPAPAPAPPAPIAAPAPPSIVTGGDLSAQMVSGKPPTYPVESRRKREEGTVVLSLIVGTDGRVESISISRSSGVARLDNAALNAVRGWRWQPLTRSGQAVRVRGIVEIPFVIRT